MLCAQDSAVFHGRVTDSVGVAIEGAQVVLREAGLSARTDSTGAFTIRRIPPGTYHVTLRRPGFGPISGTARFAPGDSVNFRFRMRRLVASLDTVRIDTSGMTSIWQAGFERRRADGFGTFLTSTDLDPRAGTPLGDIIKSKVSGLELVRWSGRLSAYGTHTPKFPCGPPFGNPCAGANGGWPDACYMQVFVDGTQRFYYAADNSHEPFDLNSFKPGEIAAIEVYVSAAETPLQFSGPGAACGTIVLWTHGAMGK